MKVRLPRWAASMPCSRRMSRCWRRTTCAEGFDARHDCTSRAYCYRVLARAGRSALERGRRAALELPGRRRAALHECAALLVGTHDFTAFTPTDTYHVRFERDVLAAYWRARATGPTCSSSGSRPTRSCAT